MVYVQHPWPLPWDLGESEDVGLEGPLLPKHPALAHKALQGMLVLPLCTQWVPPRADCQLGPATRHPSRGNQTTVTRPPEAIARLILTQLLKRISTPGMACFSRCFSLVESSKPERKNLECFAVARLWGLFNSTSKQNN